MHLSLLVLTEQRPDEADLEVLLWPWCHHNPDICRRPRWDYFEIGGRFEGLLEPEWTADTPKRTLDFSQKQKKALALESLRARAVAAAAAEYDAVQVALAGRRVPKIADLERLHGKEWSTHFHADEAVKAVRATAGFMWLESIETFNQPRDEFLASASRRAILTMAVVAQGDWHELDAFGFDDDPIKTRAWEALSDQLVCEADPDSWLTVVDCHR